MNVRLAPAAKWAPLWYTPSLSKDSDGPQVTSFGADYLRVTKGFRAGHPLIYTPWQQWLLNSLLERKPSGRRRYRRALIGLPRKNGKSLLGSGLALDGLFMGPPGAEVYSAAGDRQQAKIVFNEARQQVLDSPALLRHCRVYRDAIEVSAEGAVYRCLSADAKLQQGLNPSLVIFDEIHVQINPDLWDALTLGSGAREDPLVVGITTPGYDMTTLCGQLFNYGRAVVDGIVDDPSFGFWWWQAKDGCDVRDRKEWLRANPNLAEGLLDMEDMETSVKQTHEMAFRRYRLGQWTSSSESWLPLGAWEDCRVKGTKIDPERPFILTVDMALRYDTIAVVAAQALDNGKVRAAAQVWTPQNGELINVAEIEQAIRTHHQTGQCTAVYYDPAFFLRSAQALLDEGVNMIEFPQSHSRMVPACGQAYALIAGGLVEHDYDPVPTRQVEAAVAVSAGEGWRLSKGRTKHKIDAAIATVMALDRVTSRPEADNAKPIFAY